MKGISSPRIIGENRADFFTLESFLSFKKFQGLKGEELILAYYDYLTSTVDGSYHWWDSYENKGYPKERGRVIDSVKLFNVYGWMICGQMASVLYRIYIKSGFVAREFSLPGHSVCEVFYDDQWHYLDMDMWTWFKNEKGEIASAYELSKRAHELIVENTNKSNPCNLPDRTLEGYAKMYESAKGDNGELEGIRPEYTMQGHSMDILLRPGESIERCTEGLGYFYFPDSFKEMLKKYKGEFPGYPRERYEPFRSYGNGRLIYEPKLNQSYSDFEDGVWSYEGVKTNEQGLIGNGYCEFRIQSPYLFCGKPEIYVEENISKEGVYLSWVSTSGVKVFLTNAEEEWVEIKGSSNDQQIDITQLLDGRYDVLLRFELNGGELKGFCFDGRIQVAPMSLPRLEKGINELKLAERDSHESVTTPWRHSVDFRENAELMKQFVSIENGVAAKERPGWQCLKKIEESKPLLAVYCLEAPANKKIDWLYIESTIKETVYGHDKQYVKIEMSKDQKDWIEINKREITSSKLYWDCSLEATVNEISQNKVYIRVTSETTIAFLHFYTHLKEESYPLSQLEITHYWNDEEGEHTFEMKGSKNHYQLECPQKVIHHGFTLKMPSQAK